MKNLRAVCFSASAALFFLPLAAHPAPPDTAILAPGAAPQKVFASGEFTEGPAMGPDGCVYFSDLTWPTGSRIEDGHLWRFDPATGSCAIYRSPSGMSNGIEFDGVGRMVVCTGSDFGGRGLVRTVLGTGKSEILVSDYRNLPLNSPNDLIIDSKERIFFTDPRYGDARSVRQPVMGVYRRDPDGKLTLLIDDVPMPNGIGLSPDESIIYVGCNDEGAEAVHGGVARPPRMELLAYRLSPDGSAHSRRVLVRFPPDAGPEGFAVDRGGRLYVAVRDEKKPGIGVYTAEGQQVGWIPLPEVPSNVAFGRPPHDRTLYITAGGSLYRLEIMQRGFFPSTFH